MNPVQKLFSQCPLIERCINYTFKDQGLLVLAFVHRSFFNEHRDMVQEHNERLEFLGDSVLGLLISDYLFKQLPTHPEGELSHLRSHIVEASSCSTYLQKLGLAEFVLLGKGERMNDGRGRETILADLFEALIGAIYIDGGLEACKDFFFTHFAEEIEASLKEPLRNWKAELQDFSQKKVQKPPLYKVVKETGPDHSKIFHVAAFIEEKLVGQGMGSSKKEAEQAAAADALSKLERK
jgi:ribonuclease III